MEQYESKNEIIKAGVKEAIAQAIERHKRLGESIAVWKDGKVVILSAEEIPALKQESESKPQ
jgi:20S proteasome alpha/beta subunit